MTRRLWLIFLLLANAGLLSAQPSQLVPREEGFLFQDQTRQVSTTKDTLSLSMDSELRFWDQGALSYDDFTTRRSAFPQINELVYGVAWTSTASTKIGNTVIQAPLSRVYMNPYSSWVHPDFKSAGMLQYMQTGLDYLEVCRRRAIKDFKTGSTYPLASVMKFHMDVAESFLVRMKEDTRQGTDTAAVRYYASRVKEELAQTEDVRFDDLRIAPKGFAIALTTGIGTEFYTGPLASYVTPVAGYHIGFDITFAHFNLIFGGMAGWGGRYKRDIPREGYQWNAGEKMRGGHFEASLGYTVYDAQWWRFIPFAGVGVGFIDYPYHPVDANKESDEISGLRFQAGLATDYKVYRLVNYMSSADGLIEIAVRTCLYVAHTQFPAPAPSWTINFSVSALMQPWIVKK